MSFERGSLVESFVKYGVGTCISMVQKLWSRLKLMTQSHKQTDTQIENYLTRENTSANRGKVGQIR